MHEHIAERNEFNDGGGPAALQLSSVESTNRQRSSSSLTSSSGGTYSPLLTASSTIRSMYVPSSMACFLNVGSFFLFLIRLCRSSSRARYASSCRTPPVVCGGSASVTAKGSAENSATSFGSTIYDHARPSSASSNAVGGNIPPKGVSGGSFLSQLPSSKSEAVNNQNKTNI
jgi:hypothetical protein